MAAGAQTQHEAWRFDHVDSEASVKLELKERCMTLDQFFRKTCESAEVETVMKRHFISSTAQGNIWTRWNGRVSEQTSV